MKRLLVLPLLLLTLESCVVGPNFVKPKTEICPEWVTEANTAPPETDWWNTLSDPLLTSYIEKATLYNHNIKEAYGHILEARALIQVSASSLYPQISDDWNVSQIRFSKNGPFFAFDKTGANNKPIAPMHLLQTIFTLAFDASWEVDLFGKTYRKIEEAKSNYLASIDARNDLMITVQGDVAKMYIQVRKAQKLAFLTERQIALLRQIAGIVSDRERLGLDNNLDQHEIVAELETLEATLPGYERDVLLGIYSLSVLTGSQPESLICEMIESKELPQIPEGVEVGLKTDLLRRRPDVREAEQQLHRAVARIGVATAEFFPDFSLRGFFGFQSETIKKFFDWQSRAWFYGDNASHPLFTGGRLTGNLNAERARAYSQYQNYQQTVLLALQDAESSLTAFNQEKKTKLKLEKSVEETRIVRNLALNRFEKGLIDLKNFLDYERQLITREQDYTVSEASALIELVSLYKALGGSLSCAS